MRSSEKKEASCCNNKVRKSSLILCSFILSHTHTKKYVFTYQIHLHTLESLNRLRWFSLSGQRRNKTKQRETILSWRKSEGEGTDTRLHNDRIFLQGRGNLMLFGCELQYGNRGSSPW